MESHAKVAGVYIDPRTSSAARWVDVACTMHRTSSSRGSRSVTDDGIARPRLTFFFPAYNEEENMTETVSRALEEIGPLAGRVDRGPGRRRRVDRSHAASWPTSSRPPTRASASSTRRTAATAVRCRPGSRTPGAS